ncbi:MAG: hypothetical protein ACK5NF_04065 [Bacilli bacterium]
MGTFVATAIFFQGLDYFAGTRIIDVVKDSIIQKVTSCDVKISSRNSLGTFNIEDSNATKVAMPIEINQSKSNCIKSIKVFSPKFNGYTTSTVDNNSIIDDYLIVQQVQNYEEVDIIMLSSKEEITLPLGAIEVTNFNEKELYLSIVNVPSRKTEEEYSPIPNATRNILNHYFISVEYDNQVETYLFMYSEKIDGSIDVFFEKIEDIRETDINNFINNYGDELLCLSIAPTKFDIKITKDNYCMFTSELYLNVEEVYFERMRHKNINKNNDEISIQLYGDELSEDIVQKLSPSYVDSYIKMIIDQATDLKKIK